MKGQELDRQERALISFARGRFVEPMLAVAFLTRWDYIKEVRLEDHRVTFSAGDAQALRHALNRAHSIVASCRTKDSNSIRLRKRR